MRRSDATAPVIRRDDRRRRTGCCIQLTGDYAGPPVDLAGWARRSCLRPSTRVGRRQLWLRRLDSLTAEPLPGTEDATFPFWAPDSRAIGVLRRRQAEAHRHRTPGSALTLCDAPSGRGGTWNAQGVILFTPSGALAACSRSRPAAAARRQSRRPTGTPYTSHRWPQFLPDGRHFLYLGVQQEEGPRSERGVPRLARRPRAAAGAAIAQPGRPTPDGHLLFMRDRTLWAQPFDVEREALGGAPVAVARDVLEDPTIWRGIFSTSDTGTLDLRGRRQAGTSLTIYDRDGHEIGPDRRARHHLRRQHLARRHARRGEPRRARRHLGATNWGAARACASPSTCATRRCRCGRPTASGSRSTRRRETRRTAVLRDTGRRRRATGADSARRPGR